MLEVATLDSDLYKALEPAVDEIATLKHVRNGFIEYAEDEDFRDGFTDYATRELDDIEASFKALYKYCTGQDGVPARLR
ncbi:hypothetical protein AE618_12380 [Bosea vaviloviae]|uniref:Uncharacterized protein n=2 Tax=Bosea vaviloviae TaxID=1526658 RepID=A0A0N1N1S6_9HYPH|nr:hypothetical protein AE618_12380 [Bosea vaviloviae]